jgi:hypothetical protein
MMLPDGTSVTFDTNTIDKACRPELHPKDPARRDFDTVHEAVRTRKLRGFFCETAATLEGIQRANRARAARARRFVTTAQRFRPTATSFIGSTFKLLNQNGNHYAQKTCGASQQLLNSAFAR